MKKYTVLLILLCAVVASGAALYVLNNQGELNTMTDKNTAQIPMPTNSEMLDKPGELEVKTRDVSYYDSARGFYAAPEKKGTYPGVVMIHEWWGLNDNIKDMARQLASEGYHVLAVDLYSGKVAKIPQEAQKLVSSHEQEKSIANMKSAKKYLLSQGAMKIAVLGWCFGGGQSLQASLSEPFDATVIYYGTPLVVNQERLSSIKGPVLGIFGDKDEAIPVDEVRKFEDSLNELGIENQVYIYAGVGHAFANPSGNNYAPDETKDAWEKTLDFLSKLKA